MKVEIWADLVCPWCYLGQARFRQALDGFAHRDRVDVVYRSFELDPNAPAATDMVVLDMLASKYGMSRAQAQAAEDRIAGLARAQGLPFSADRGHGNTFDAHRIVQLAATLGRGREVIDALYRAHFSGDGSIFNTDSIVKTAGQAGLDPARAREVLAGTEFADQVRADERAAAEIGVTGVPFFVANGSLAVSGAQSGEVMSRLLEQAWQAAAA